MLRGLVAPANAAGNGKPLQVTTYTSGTGTYTPVNTNSWVRVTVVAGGAGGVKPLDNSSGAGAGGAAGGTAIAWLRLSGPVTYSVGSRGSGYSGPGTSGPNPGGRSFFHTVIAYPGDGSTAVPQNAFHVICGGAGAPGGSGVSQNGRNGRAAGIPNYASFSFDSYAGRSLGGYGNGEGNGGGSGGDSLYGIGGNGGNGPLGAGLQGGAGADATGYGAGGGGGACSYNGLAGASGSGSGGIIIVEDFGA